MQYFALLDGQMQAPPANHPHISSPVSPLKMNRPTNQYSERHSEYRSDHRHRSLEDNYSKRAHVDDVYPE